METNTFTITKRDGQVERFSLDKIMNAIIKAFDAMHEPIDLGKLSKILALLDIHDGITVEDIVVRTLVTGANMVDTLLAPVVLPALLNLVEVVFHFLSTIYRSRPAFRPKCKDKKKY